MKNPFLTMVLSNSSSCKAPFLHAALFQGPRWLWGQDSSREGPSACNSDRAQHSPPVGYGKAKQSKTDAAFKPRLHPFPYRRFLKEAEASSIKNIIPCISMPAIQSLALYDLCLLKTSKTSLVSRNFRIF